MHCLEVVYDYATDKKKTERFNVPGRWTEFLGQAATSARGNSWEKNRKSGNCTVEGR